MKKLTDQYQFLLALITLVFALNATCMGQSVWVDEGDRRSAIGIELMIPSVDDFLATEFPSSAISIYGRALINEAVSLKASLPISHLSEEGGISETDIGNVYLGFEFHDLSPGLNIDLGLRIPTAPDNGFGLLTGYFLENYNLGIYMPETLSLSSNLKYRQQSETGLIVRAGGGPDVLIPSDDGDGVFDRKTELFLNYYGQVLYGTDNFSIGGGLMGLLFVTEEDLSFGDRTLHDLGIMGSYSFDSAKLDAYIRFPIGEDEFDGFVDFVLGLNLSFSL